MSTWVRFVDALTPLWAILAALMVSSVFVLMSGVNPIEAFAALFSGAFLNYYGFGATLVKFCPLLLAGLAVAIPLRAGLFNIGGEGQIYLGALAATVVALNASSLQPVVAITMSCVAGMAAGALWAALAAFLQAWRQVNEVISTILLNFVAISAVSYAVSGPIKDPNASYLASPEIAFDLWLPILLAGTDAHVGALFGLVLVVIGWVVFRFTAIGFAIDTTGKNPQAAAYAGIPVNLCIISVMAVGGAMAGLAGALEILGLKYRLFSQVSPGYGYTGIIVALLVGSRFAMLPVSALFMAGLLAGAGVMSRAVGVDATLVGIIQGLVVVFVAASLVVRPGTLVKDVLTRMHAKSGRS